MENPLKRVIQKVLCRRCSSFGPEVLLGRKQFSEQQEEPFANDLKARLFLGCWHWLRGSGGMQDAFAKTLQSRNF